MKDIDFDELDKAVNSLMNASANDTNAAAPTTDNVSEQTAPEPVPQKDPPASAPATVPEEKGESVAVQSTAAPAPKPATPAKRRGGRFMDVMPSGASARPVSTRASREGVSLAPLGATNQASAAPDTTQQVEETPVVEPETPPSQTDESPTMPDPIDMMDDAKDETNNDATPVDVSEATPVEDESDTASKEGSIADEGGSPFLADTKVEKRPLGGDNAPLEENPVDEGKGDADEPGADEPPAQPAPAEYNADVVAVEAGEPKEFAKTVHEAKVEAAESATVSGAINQQYKEEASTGDESHAAIYDTQDYPNTAKPAKKKSGWLWVLWIFILLSLGAGGAVILYFMNII